MSEICDDRVWDLVDIVSVSRERMTDGFGSLLDILMARLDCRIAYRSASGVRYKARTMFGKNIRLGISC